MSLKATILRLFTSLRYSAILRKINFNIININRITLLLNFVASILRCYMKRLVNVHVNWIQKYLYYCVSVYCQQSTRIHFFKFNERSLQLDHYLHSFTTKQETIGNTNNKRLIDEIEFFKQKNRFIKLAAPTRLDLERL